MKSFTRILLATLISGVTFFSADAQSVLNPADPIINYDSLNPPTQPPYGQIGKWVRRPSLNWNTESYKAYVYKGVPFRLKFPKSYVHGVNDGKKYPMLMFWHGLLEAGDIHDNEYSMFLGAQLFRDYVDNGTFDGFVIFMQAPINGGSFFASGHFQFMTEIIDYMTANNKLDPFRIISNGLSSGGMATWNMFLQHTNYVSSVIAMSAPGNWTGADIVDKSKFNPVWYAHGGEDNNPDLYTGNMNNDAMVAAGANWRRVMYPGAYHDTWGATWWDPDFWPFVNRSYSSNPWSLFGKKLFAAGEPVNATIGLAPGYDQYEWRRNGVIISGATSRSITVNQLGVYDARVRRGTLWSEWSKIPVELKEGTIVTPPPPPPGSATRIEAESFTSMSGIQSEPTSDVGGGLNIGWQDNNDWLNYSVNVPTAGTYTLSFRVATAFGGAEFQLRKSDGTAVSTVTVPNTGGFQTWQTIYALATLPAGQQTLRIYTTNSNGGWNINWWEIPGTPNGGSTGNQAPTANAGTNQTITLPTSSTTLTGSGTDPDGTIASYAWTKVSGPAGGNIGSPSSASTSVTNLAQGTYVFRLTVTDNAGATASADVTVTVNAATTSNQAPTANAGNDQTITLPTSSTTLNGSGADTDGTIASYAWSKVSGPAGGTIGSPSSASTAISNLELGTYIFRLTVTDNAGATGADDVSVTVNATTTPPTGSIKIEAENYTNMAGIQTEPTADAGGGLNVGWQDTNDWMDYAVNMASAGTYTVNFRVATMFNGPQFQLRNSAGSVLATVNVPYTGGFQNWQTVSASVTLPAGAQTLRIFTSNAAGGWNINWWEISGASQGTNQSPTANAGNDQTITLPTSSTTLNGSGADADGTIAAYAWTKISGPAGGTIGSPSSASTTISNLAQGSYVFRLTVTDNAGATGSDDITITVNASTTPPSSSVKIEAENYINMSGIQTEPTADAGGGLNVGWQDTNDWMDYSVNMSSAGTYTVRFRVATMFNGPQFQLRNSAGSVLATVNVPNTGGFQNWQTVSASVSLPAGAQTLRILTSNAAGGWNINWWEIVGASSGTTNVAPTANAGSDQTITLPTTSTTLNGSGADTDGTIASYAWSKVSGPAGETFGSASSASTTVSNLAQGTYVFRLSVTDNSGATATDDVTITVNGSTTTPPPTVSLKIEAESYSQMSGVLTETTSDVGGGLNVKNIDQHDWMDYSVNIPAAGVYDLNFRVSALNNGSQFQLRNSSGNTLTTVNFSKTNSTQVWKTVSVQVTLPAGQQTLRIHATKSNGGWNMNWWEIKSPPPAAVAGQKVMSEEVEEVISATEMEIFPNPVKDALQLVVRNENKGRLKIQVMNMTGEVVKEIQLDKPFAGSVQTRLSLNTLAPGLYIIRSTIGEWSQVTRLVKQ